ncbi:MAG: ABC transporter permease [Chloroflexi bacterium]|nr:ABC transporter permease [Chloroflexota bacterium]
MAVEAAPFSAPGVAAPPAPRRGRSPLRLFLTNKKAVIGATMLATAISVAILAPLLSPQDPLAQELTLRLRGPFWEENARAGYLLGTDHVGRDILTRLFYGARYSLAIAAVSVSISLTVGVLLGLVAGYFGGLVDSSIMRLADIQLGFPTILLVIAAVAIIGASIPTLILVMGLTNWVIYARTVRGLVLSIREQEFVEAARALGASPGRIIARHVFPQTIPVLLVIGTLQSGWLIILESTLSFLGLGIPAPTPSWGSMLNDGADYIRDAWWLTTFPGLAIMVTVVGVNFLGDGLRDLLDPRLRRTLSD